MKNLISFVLIFLSFEYAVANKNQCTNVKSDCGQYIVTEQYCTQDLRVLVENKNLPGFYNGTSEDFEATQITGRDTFNATLLSETGRQEVAVEIFAKTQTDGTIRKAVELHPIKNGKRLRSTVCK